MAADAAAEKARDDLDATYEGPTDPRLVDRGIPPALGKGAAQASLAARAWLDSHVTNDPSSQQHSDLYADLYEVFGDAHDIQETS